MRQSQRRSNGVMGAFQSISSVPRRRRALLILGLLIALAPGAATGDTFHFTSSMDGVEQPALFFPAKARGPRPLLVLLHTWSVTYDSFAYPPWVEEAQARGWHTLIPEFRGPNNRPEACASPYARQDILDAVTACRIRAKVDAKRIYLAGVSGGAHMAMVMASHTPDLWAGVSAWAGISDLTAWWYETRAAGRRYWRDIEAATGGRPGVSERVDTELRFRSPVFHLHKAKHTPLDLNTGIHDGHEGSVPIHHTLDAFNAIAAALRAPAVREDEIARLSSRNPLSSEEEQDPEYGRPIHLRRYAGPSRVTIFEGGHEGIPAAAVAWLARQAKP